MASLSVTPMQWKNIRDLSDVEPLSDADLECLAEIRSVLDRYQAVDRFAVHLVHKHFDLAADEILVEYSDAVKRIQTICVEKIADADMQNSIPTTWILDGLKPTTICVCATRAGSHLGRHETG